MKVVTLDNSLTKSQVKGFIRYRKGKSESVSPFSRKDKPKASGEDSGAWHSRTMARMKTLPEESLRFIIKDATEAADNLESIDINHPKAGKYRDEAHYAAMEIQRRLEAFGRRDASGPPALKRKSRADRPDVAGEREVEQKAAHFKTMVSEGPEGEYTWKKFIPKKASTVVPGSAKRKIKWYDPSDFKVSFDVAHEDFGEDEVREIGIVDFKTYKGSKGGMYEPPEPPGIEDVVYAWASGPKEGQELTDDEERKYILRNKEGKRSIESIFEEQLKQYLADQDEAARDDYYDRKYNEMVGKSMIPSYAMIKSQVKGFIRYKRGKMERVSPYHRAGEARATPYEFKVGDKVQYSDDALRHDRDYYLGLGEPGRKSAAKEHYEKRRALTGTIKEILAADPKRGVSSGYAVEWDNGTTSRLLPYMISAKELPTGGVTEQKEREDWEAAQLNPENVAYWKEKLEREGGKEWGKLVEEGAAEARAKLAAKPIDSTAAIVKEHNKDIVAKKAAPAKPDTIGGVKVKDIVARAYPDYKGRKISVRTDYIPKSLNSYWDEGHRTYYSFYELATGKSHNIGSNHPMFEAAKPRNLSELPKGVVIVAQVFAGTSKWVTIYAHPEDMTATSHAGTIEETLKNFTKSMTWEMIKAQVKGFTRTRKGKLETVKPHTREGQFGSQNRESLEHAGYDLVSRKGGREVILKDKETGKYELWGKKDDFAGYTIDINGTGYEFIRGVDREVQSPFKTRAPGGIPLLKKGIPSYKEIKASIRLKKGIAPDEWERPKKPHWHKDPDEETQEGIRARASYEKEESKKIPGHVKPFSRVRRGKVEHVMGYEKKKIPFVISKDLVTKIKKDTKKISDTAKEIRALPTLSEKGSLIKLFNQTEKEFKEGKV